MRVAILDPDKRLIGVRTVDKAGKADIDAGDLPADGRYRWDGKTFIPQGYGHGKPGRPAVDRDRAFYLAMTALLDGRPIPQEVRAWCTWYERHG
jgi:hypothetical protein